MGFVTTGKTKRGQQILIEVNEYIVLVRRTGSLLVERSDTELALHKKEIGKQSQIPEWCRDTIFYMRGPWANPVMSEMSQDLEGGLGYSPGKL